MTSDVASVKTRARRIVGVNASECICTAALQRLKSMRAPSTSWFFAALQPCSAQIDARRLLQAGLLQRYQRCDGARGFSVPLHSIAHAARGCSMQRPLAVHSVQSTAWMERRRPALPEESSERARGVLCAKRIYSFSLSIHFEWGCSGGQTGAREHPELKRARYSLQTYRGRQLQTLGCIARAHVEYPLPQSSCSSRAARRKAPPTRAHK